MHNVNNKFNEPILHTSINKKNIRDTRKYARKYVIILAMEKFSYNKIISIAIASIFIPSLLTGCTSKEIYNTDLKVVKDTADEAYSKESYEKAGELYFRLWCSNPNEKENALLKSVNAYLKAKKYQEVLDLVEDLIIMKGENYNNYEPLFIKTLAYYNQVNSSETDINHAYNALANLKMYREFSREFSGKLGGAKLKNDYFSSSKSSSILSKAKAEPQDDTQKFVDEKELNEMEKYLKDIITYHKLKSTYQAYSHVPPSLISAMQQAKVIMDEHPGSDVAKAAKEIWIASASMLNLREAPIKTPIKNNIKNKTNRNITETMQSKEVLKGFLKATDTKEAALGFDTKANDVITDTKKDTISIDTKVDTVTKAANATTDESINATAKTDNTTKTESIKSPKSDVVKQVQASDIKKTKAAIISESKS